MKEYRVKVIELSRNVSSIPKFVNAVGNCEKQVLNRMGKIKNLHILDIWEIERELTAFCHSTANRTVQALSRITKKNDKRKKNESN